MFKPNGSPILSSSHQVYSVYKDYRILEEHDVAYFNWGIKGGQTWGGFFSP